MFHLLILRSLVLLLVLAHRRLGEHVGPLQVAGAALVIAGVIVVGVAAPSARVG